MEIILGVATFLGGIAAIWFFSDKFIRKNQWTESKKVVNSNWWESSELKKRLEAKGYTFRWSDDAAVEERKAHGYEIIYEEDKSNKIKFTLVNKSGQVLIGRISTNRPGSERG